MTLFKTVLYFSWKCYCSDSPGIISEYGCDATCPNTTGDVCGGDPKHGYIVLVVHETGL